MAGGTLTGAIAQGLNLTLYGMGTVIVFLSLLILVTMSMSKIILGLEKGSGLHSIGNVNSQSHDKSSPDNPTDIDAPHIKAVIAEAVRVYRSQHP